MQSEWIARLRSNKILYGFVRLRINHSNEQLIQTSWIDELDLRAFGKEVRALGRRLASNEGDADLRHFRKIRRWSGGSSR